MSTTIDFKIKFNKALSEEKEESITKDIHSFLLGNQRPTEEEIDFYCRNRSFTISIENNQVLVYHI